MLSSFTVDLHNSTRPRFKPQIIVRIWEKHFYFSSKHMLWVLIQTVLLSTQNTCKNWWIRNTLNRLLVWTYIDSLLPHPILTSLVSTTIPILASLVFTPPPAPNLTSIYKSNKITRSAQRLNGVSLEIGEQGILSSALY